MTRRQTDNAPISQEVIDRYFLEHRAKLIDLAAFLDRVDRAGDAQKTKSDYRVAAMLKALEVLSDGKANRAGRILTVFSDAATALPQSAGGAKGATGAAKEGDPV